MATEPPSPRRPEDEPPDDGAVLLFGSWPVAYAAVAVSAVVVMVLVGLFSWWPW